VAIWGWDCSDGIPERPRRDRERGVFPLFGAGASGSLGVEPERSTGSDWMM
jgi:hypothetical protein